MNTRPDPRARLWGRFAQIVLAAVLAVGLNAALFDRTHESWFLAIGLVLGALMVTIEANRMLAPKDPG